MAGWLSSKLKAAEQLLQQIDQQAAVVAKKEGLSDENTPEKLSQPLRKEKEAFAGPSTSQQVSPTWGQGRLFDRQLNLSKPGGKRDVGEQSGGSSSRKSSRTAPSQFKSERIGREDWSEFLGSSDLQISASAFRSSNGKTTDLDGHNGASVKSSRTKSLATKSISNLPLSAPTQSSGLSSDSDALTSTVGKSVPQQLSPSRISMKIVQIDSHVSAENVTTSSIVGDLVNGNSVEEPKKMELMTDHVAVDSDLAREGLSGKSIILPSRAAPASDGDSDGEKQEGQRNLETSSAVNGGVLLETPSTDVLATSDTSDIKENMNAVLSGNEFVENGASEHALRIASDVQESEEQTELLSLSVEEPSDSTRTQGEEALEDGNENLASSFEGVRGLALSRKFSNGRLESDGNPPDGNISLEEDAASVSGSEEEDSDTATDRDSDSDSEYEEKRARRAALRRKLRKQRAEEAKAVAEEAVKAAIREREEFLEALEQEKDTLEALLAEGEEQHLKKAEEMRATMIEVTQLLEQEKHFHNITRRQALELEVSLERENAELARALATAQWNLEEISSRVSKARALVEAKEGACANLEREAATLHFRLARQTKSESRGNDSSEAESLEEEKSILIPKIEHFRLRAEDLEDNLKRIMNRHQTPTPIQLELEAQLSQITDSLLQKQAQLEDLSTEKATLVFRVEAASNSLREAKVALASQSSIRNTKRGSWAIENWSSFDEDLEYGMGKSYSAKDKNWDNQDKYDHFTEASSGQPLRRLVRQVDSLVMGAALILRRSGTARVFAFLYMLALHSWFVFIVFSHPTILAEDKVNPGNYISLSNSANQNMTSLF